MASEVSRREFLRFIKDSAISVYKKNLVRRAIVPVVATTGVDWGVREFRASILERRAEERLKNSTDFFPGSTLIRNKIDWPYMSSHGPIPWYDAMLATPTIGRAAQKVFNSLLERPLSHPSAGTLLHRLFLESHESLLTDTQIYYPNSQYSDRLDDVFKHPRYRDELLLNFATTAAALLNPYTEHFSEKIGLPSQTFNSAWDKNSGFMRKFEGAGILRAHHQDSSVEYDGLDRLVHMTHHMALVVILGLSKKHALPYHLQTPPGFGPIPDYGQVINAETALKQASLWAGLLYEGVQTFKVGNLRRTLHGLPVQDGFFDTEWRFDVTANFLGSLLGLKVLRANQLSSLSDIFGVLNNPELARTMKTPQIPQQVADHLLR